MSVCRLVGWLVHVFICALCNERWEEVRLAIVFIASVFFMFFMEWAHVQLSRGLKDATRDSILSLLTVFFTMGLIWILK